MDPLLSKKKDAIKLRRRTLALQASMRAKNDFRLRVRCTRFSTFYTQEGTRVDEEEYMKYKGKNLYLTKKGYVCWDKLKNTFEGKPTRISLHRAIMAKELYGDLVVDHINRNRTDNRKSNLRVCTRSQNVKNKSSTYKGLKGVDLTSCNEWKSKFLGHSLGIYPFAEKAAVIRDIAAFKESEFYCLNYKGYTNENLDECYNWATDPSSSQPSQYS